jgi:hypothetical protein
VYIYVGKFKFIGFIKVVVGCQRMDWCNYTLMMRDDGDGLKKERSWGKFGEMMMNGRRSVVNFQRSKDKLTQRPEDLKLEA